MNIVAEIITARTKDRKTQGTDLQTKADGRMSVYKVIYRGDDETELKETRKDNRILAYAIDIPGCSSNPRYYGIKKGIVVEMKGTIEKIKGNVKYLFRATDIVVRSSHAMKKMLDEQGIDVKAKRAKLIKDTQGETTTIADGENLQERADEDDETLEYNRDSVAINTLLGKHGYKVDIEVANDINTFFKYRAADFHEESVADMLERHPHILTEVDYQIKGLFSVEQINAHFPNDNASKAEKAFARLCMMMHHAAQQGNSFVPIATVMGWLKKDFKAMGINYNDQVAWIDEVLKEHNNGIISRNASFDRFRGYARIYRLTKDDSQKYASSLARYYSAKFDHTIPRGRFYGALYLARSRNAEKEAARLLAKHVGEHRMEGLLQDLKEGNYIEKDFIRNDKKCMQALRNAFSYKASAIVGCAGSGKSTLVGTLVNILNGHGNMPSMILAPSAMASAVAADKVRENNRTKECAKHKTVHGFAKMVAEEADMGTEWGYDLDGMDEPLEEGVKFLIIDEMSMCSIPMLHKMLKQLENNPDVHIVFVGDAAQLPAIGQQFFYLIADEDSPFHETIPTVRFTENHRADSNDIDKVTQDVREGKDIVIPKDSKSIVLEDVSIDSYFKKHKGYSAGTLYISGNSANVNTLNEILMKKHLGSEDARIMIPETEFAIGEKVMNIKNDYFNPDKPRKKDRHKGRVINVYNGTFGIIKSYDAEEDTVMVEMQLPDAEDKKSQLIPYKACELHRYLTPAYAITVHKAQGSQADNVVFFSEGTKDRAMVYTAMTRAGKKLTIIGKLQELNEAVKKVKRPGYTALYQRFEDELQKMEASNNDISLAS